MPTNPKPKQSRKVARSKPKPKPKPKQNQPKRRAATARRGPPGMSVSRRPLPSPHHYLNPFYHSGHVPSSRIHAPFINITSARRWTVNTAANEGIFCYLTHTDTVCRGIVQTWIPGSNSQGFGIIATQLNTVSPTHVAYQRLGLRISNVAAALTVTGMVYHYHTNDPILLPQYDNVADNFTRVLDADMVTITDRITTASRTRFVTAQSLQREPLEAIVTVTDETKLWKDFQAIDVAAVGANLGFYSSLTRADQDNNISAVCIWIPPQPILQQFMFEMVSEDGCRFDGDHALFGAQQHAPIISSSSSAKMYVSAHVAAKHGEKAPKAAAAHEKGFMSEVGSFIKGVGEVGEEVYNAVPRLAAGAAQLVKGGRFLRTLIGGARAVAPMASLLL